MLKQPCIFSAGVIYIRAASVLCCLCAHRELMVHSGGPCKIWNLYLRRPPRLFGMQFFYCYYFSVGEIHPLLLSCCFSLFHDYMPKIMTIICSYYHHKILTTNLLNQKIMRVRGFLVQFTAIFLECLFHIEGKYIL